MRPRARLACAITTAALALLTPALFAAPALATEPFAIETFSTQVPGGPVIQAGSHPASLTVSGAVSTHIEGGAPAPNANPKTIEVNFPAGVVINPTATTIRCAEFELEKASCPAASAVGTIKILTHNLGEFAPTGLYNMIPSSAVSADFAANLEGTGIIIHMIGKVRTGGDYGISGFSPEITQIGGMYAFSLTLNESPSYRSPLLRMPTSCSHSPLAASIDAFSWQEPENLMTRQGAVLDGEGSPAFTGGCERMNFSPQLSVRPSTTATDSPSGLAVELSVPQLGGEVTEPDLKEAVLTLPAGMSVSTAAAAGLGACAPQQIALTTPAAPTCPASSKVGSAELQTPLLEAPLHGALYLAQQGNAGPAQGENPFHSLLALYLVLEGPGVVVKLPGVVNLDPVTGQLTTRFGEDPLTGFYQPQLPFSRLKLDFFGDPRAPLTTPSQCGTYTVTSRLTPWSAPESGPAATPSSSFEIDQGCHGPVFAPSFTAGTVNNRAGAYSPFAMTFGRADGEGELGRLQLKMPPGLLANVASVPQCPEPQASLGECPQASLVGHVMAGVGAGPNQLWVPGTVYLTGPYRGAPFGLAIEVPAIAGPFNLDTGGRPVVDRAAISIDPHTSAVTVTSDPLPQILQGIPLQIRTVNVSIDRPGFSLNPTSCAPGSVAAQLTSAEGQSASVATPFQAADCASLAFTPKVSVTVSGKTSKVRGASFDFKIAFPGGSLGSQANFAKAKVQLPRRLPSRLTTLQKACLAAVFEANPANCPAASVVGVVRATTPILPGTLTGPAYFVSYGGAKFPELIIVLQGAGVRVDLHGETFISKAGITSSTFSAIPDVPISSFEIYLPQGPYSVLAANGNLCTGSLQLPMAFTAQNGAEIHQTSNIAVTGCPKAKGARARRARRARNAQHDGTHHHGRNR